MMECGWCGETLVKSVSAINRAKKIGAKLFCNKACFGLNRRTTKADKVEKKRIYDEKYRETNVERLKARKKEYYQKVHDPVKEAIDRKKGMVRHVEYCRQPEYRKWKKQYDQRYRAKALYGEFWEAAVNLWNLEGEVSTRMSKYDIYSQNGTLNKWIKRRRDYENTFCK